MGFFSALFSLRWDYTRNARGVKTQACVSGLLTGRGRNAIMVGVLLAIEGCLLYDVAIIGAGPAGSTLARLIGDRYSVLLVDKRDITGPADIKSHAKCCGGLLAPDAQAMLSRMGLGLPKKVTTGPQLFSVRAIDIPARIERHYQRFYINMDRLEFDRWLLSLVPCSVDLRLGWRFVSYESAGEGYKIELRRGDEKAVARAKALVGADGALSPVRRLGLGDAPRPRRYFAIQEWFEADDILPYFSSIFDPEITDYYSWTIPKNDMLLVGAALPPGNGAAERFELLKQRLHAFGFELKNRVRREGTYIMRPIRMGHIRLGRESIFLVGEAAGFISPSSAEGFSYAFKSAIALADAMRPSLQNVGRRYYAATRRLAALMYVKNLKSRVIYGPRLRKIVMLSGLASMKIRESSPPENRL